MEEFIAALCSCYPFGLKTHMLTHTGKKHFYYWCFSGGGDHCGFVQLLPIQSQNSHVNTHWQETFLLFWCFSGGGVQLLPIRSQNFIAALCSCYPFGLKTHMLTHTGKKHFYYFGVSVVEEIIAALCSCYPFSLKTHMLTHTGKKPFYYFGVSVVEEFIAALCSCYPFGMRHCAFVQLLPIWDAACRGLAVKG